jgi:hypothetical protein
LRDESPKRAALAAAAIEDARFVEVDMAFDETRDHQAAIELLGRRVGGDALANVDDAAIGNGDVDKRLFGFGPPRLPQYEIDRHGGHLGF